MIHNLTRAIAGWGMFCCLALAVCARAQDSSDAGGQTPLGDVVRHQQEQRKHSKPAKKIVTDDDLPANHMRRFNAWVAEFVIIPAIKISSTAPIDDSTEADGQKKSKVDIWFGPHLGDPDSCSGGTPECAEQAFLRRYRSGSWAGSTARILFDSDDQVGDYPARVAHFEVVHEVRGKMLGTVALIQTPFAVLTAACIYNAKDQPDAEPECDAFISSLQVDVPEKYIYVEHH
jgi:hypothetical protein